MVYSSLLPQAGDSAGTVLQLTLVLSSLAGLGSGAFELVRGLSHIVLQLLNLHISAASLRLGGSGAVLLLDDATLQLAQLRLQAVGCRVITGSFLKMRIRSLDGRKE